MEISTYNTDLNFWEQYPETKNITPFKAFRLSDKIKNRTKSSKLMWAFASYVDLSTRNPLSNLPNEDKIEIIEDDFISGKFDLDKYKEHIDVMRKLLLSRERMALSNLIQKLEERTKLIQDTKYSIENADKLDKLIGNTDTLLEAIKKMEASIDAGSSEGAVKGGRTESISEKGVI